MAIRYQLTFFFITSTVNYYNDILGSHNSVQHNTMQTRMWANAQRDGRPAEYRWRPVLNAAVWLAATA